MNQHNMFLHNVTLIDAAYLDSEGRPRGISVNPVFTVSGQLNGQEQVVSDFSSIKKEIKQLIDHHETGFDHKLWVDTELFDIKDLGPGGWRVDTDFLWLVAPSNAIRPVQHMLDATNPDHKLEPQVARLLEEYLNERLHDRGLVIRVAVPEPKPVDVTVLLDLYGIESAHAVVEEFAYTHGLPFSTSWGCQNILHGHTSWLALGVREPELGQMATVRNLAKSIQQYLHNAYLLDKATEKQIDNGLGIRYTTERGFFALDLHEGTVGDVETITLQRAPTIENIVAHVAHIYADELTEAGVDFMGISEGLWKGAHLAGVTWHDLEAV